MNECWSGSPSERPSFAYLVDKFERMLEDGSDYLDCNIKMVSNPAYFVSDEDQGNIHNIFQIISYVIIHYIY